MSGRIGGAREEVAAPFAPPAASALLSAAAEARVQDGDPMAGLVRAIATTVSAQAEDNARTRRDIAEAVMVLRGMIVETRQIVDAEIESAQERMASLPELAAANCSGGRKRLHAPALALGGALIVAALLIVAASVLNSPTPRCPGTTHRDASGATYCTFWMARP